MNDTNFHLIINQKVKAKIKKFLEKSRICFSDLNFDQKKKNLYIENKNLNHCTSWGKKKKKNLKPEEK